MHAIQNDSHLQLQQILENYQSVFCEELSELKGFNAQIFVDPTVAPIFCRAQSVPYSMRVKVEEELDRLVQDKVLEPVQFSSWAAPIVPVLKADKTSIRICGDFKLAVNRASKLDQYPLPRVEDLFSTLSGGKTFSKLDMSQAYQQLPLSQESKSYLVINTHRGLFRYNRLPFGVSSASAIFQRVMESLLKGIPGVVAYLDDILITGKTDKDHLKSLDEVLSRLETAGLRLKKWKCHFLRNSVVYLGHHIDSIGLSPCAEKVQAVRDAPAPTNVSELKSLLGLLNYYSKFLPNISTVLTPLYRLLRHSTPWHWGQQEMDAFQASKKLLTSAPVRFDHTLGLSLVCDASSYGIGEVFLHQMPDGTEKPIAFALQSLSEAEKKFHTYLYSRAFSLITDHKPLITLLNEKKAIPPQASGRIQRWALTLSAYEYKIRYRSTDQHSHADAMSRLPFPDVPSETAEPAETILAIENMDKSPVTSSHIKTWTNHDPLFSRVLHHLQEGWPHSFSDPELLPFFKKRCELSLQDECLLWGGRVVVPKPGRELLLQELHSGHPVCLG